jgi:hypothetical protein
MPILSYWPDCSDQYGGCKYVTCIIQNNMASLHLLCFYRYKVLASKALRIIYFYVNVAES